MLIPKKRRTAEIRWLVTFADLVTLLFCFFVYLSLFTKPTVNLHSRFEITESVIKILDDTIPINIVSALQTLSGKIFSSRDNFVEALSTMTGKREISTFKNQIVLESIADEYVKESSPVIETGVTITEPLDEEDLLVPLFFGGSARKGPVNPSLCTEQGITQQQESLLRFDYLLPAEEIILRKGEKSASMHICIVNDRLFEGLETIRIRIGNVRDVVKRGAIISKNIMIIDDEKPPHVQFDIERREIFKGLVSITAEIDRTSELTSEIPVRFSGSAKKEADYRLIDSPVIKIFPFTSKGSIHIEVIQEDVPLYSTRTLTVEIADEGLRNATKGRLSLQKNTIVGALEMKDCSGINRFLRENHLAFTNFELKASKTRCILSLPSDFLFKSGSAELKEKHLGKFAGFLEEIRTRYELEGDYIKVEGHTDNIPIGANLGFDNNWELSILRATNVAMFMIEEIGFVSELLSISGHADTRPRTIYVQSNGEQKTGSAMREARRANRRVDLIFARPPTAERVRRFFPDME